MGKSVNMEDMVIDTGMTKVELSESVSVRDFITIKRDCAALLGDYITGKALDVTLADSYADSEIQGECGKGIEIAVGLNIHPELSDRLIKTTDENEIPYFIEAYPGSTGTDAWNMQISREGVSTLLLSVPIRYMHSSIEVVKYEDIKALGGFVLFSLLL